MSPALFAIYIDDLIVRLKASQFGCHLNGAYYGCLVYADDILLLSHSVQTMRYMLDILLLIMTSSLSVRSPLH